MPKPKFALYWAASCGGCEIAFLDIREKILDFDAAADLVFCPCVMDTKYKDIEAMADGEIDVTLFNGGIRNEENLHIAKLLRQKSKVLVAFGSCATEGCIPGLANLTTKEEIMDYVYRRSPSVEAGNTTLPQMSRKPAPGRLTLPALFEVPAASRPGRRRRLPGARLPAGGRADLGGRRSRPDGKLPPKGSLVGVNPKTVCDECKRTKEEKKIKAFRRPHLVDPRDIDPVKCLLGAGDHLQRPRHPRRLRGSLPPGQPGLPRLLRPGRRHPGRRGQAGRGRSPRSSTATTPPRSRRSSTRSSTRSARSTGSAWPDRSSGGA